MKTNKKNNALLIIAGGAFLIAIIAYLLFQNYQLQQKLTPPQPPTAVPLSPETANWKTYANTTDGFELKYPSNLETEGSSADDVFYIQTIGWTTNKATLPESYRIQVTYLKDKAYSVEKYMNLDFEKIPPLPKPDFIQTTINGISTVVKTYKDESYSPWGGNKEYYLYKDKKGVILAGSGKNHKILDQILSTFQFTNP